jgi:hypothetical protein
VCEALGDGAATGAEDGGGWVQDGRAGVGDDGEGSGEGGGGGVGVADGVEDEVV